MSTLEITNIDKPDRFSPVEAIQRFAGSNWGPWTRAEAVQWAEIPGNKFVVKGPLRDYVDVMVMPPKTTYGEKYLQTRADYSLGNNLLSLPAITLAQILYGNRS